MVAQWTKKQCVQNLSNLGITNKKSYQMWGVAGGHPDKGGDGEIFAQVSGCHKAKDYGIPKTEFRTVRPRGGCAKGPCDCKRGRGPSASRSVPIKTYWNATSSNNGRAFF